MAPQQTAFAAARAIRLRIENAPSKRYSTEHAKALESEAVAFAALRTWAQKLIAEHAPERYEQLRPVFEARLVTQAHRDKLADILMRFDPRQLAEVPR